MEEEKYGRSFPGCMKGLVHFLNLHHHLHLRKMKLLTYRKHGEGKRAARNKEPKTDPDAPSASQQYVCTEDACLGVEDKSRTRKHTAKSSIRLSIPKWKSREHNKKRKVSLPTPKLLRTSSIHHWSEDHADNVNFGLEISFIKQNADVDKASSSSEQACSFDEHNFDKQCDENMDYSKNGPFGPIQPDELESILQIKQLHLSNTLNEADEGSFAQQDNNAKELQGDVILHPSKEFLAMMKLFNGNKELIRNILDDPSFIFAHYLQAKQASKAELTRAYSFPASRSLESKNDGQFRINHKNFESESLAEQIYKFHSENSPAYTDMIQDDTTNAEMMDGYEERNPKLVETNIHSEELAASNILQNVRNNPSNSNRFMDIKQNKKEHHRIFMDGILHKIPFGRRLMESMKKSKSGWWDGSKTIEKPDGAGLKHVCWNKINKKVMKNIHRSQSLNDSLDKYSDLYDSISKEEFKRLPERMKVRSLGRIFSLPDIKYCSSSKNAQSEGPFSFPKNLTTSHTEEILEKEESKEFTAEEIPKWMVTDCWKIPLQINEKEQSESCQIFKKMAKDVLITEDNKSVTLQGENLPDEAHPYEPTKPTLVSATGALARGLEHRYLLEHSSLFDNNAAYGLETNEIELAKAKPYPDTDFLDSLRLRIDQKDEAKFNYVREILTRSGFSGNDFLGAWHSLYQPMDPLIFNEPEDSSYELDITEDEHDILLEHQLLFDLINETLVETYETFFGYFFPWLSSFNTNNRPKPMGDHILEEIWTKISWHLKGQPPSDITVEDIVSRNFMKNDGWMNVQFDIEDVVLELECLILGALLDDIVLQLYLLPDCNPFPR